MIRPATLLLALVALTLSPVVQAEDGDSSSSTVSPTPISASASFDHDAGAYHSVIPAVPPVSGEVGQPAVSTAPSPGLDQDAPASATQSASTLPAASTPSSPAPSSPSPSFSSPTGVNAIAAAAQAAPACAPSSVYAISRDGTMYELKQGTYSRWTAMPNFSLSVPRRDWQTELCTVVDPVTCRKPQLNSLGVGVVKGKTVWYALQRRTVKTSSGAFVPEIIVFRADATNGWTEFGRGTVGRAMPATWYQVPNNTQAEVFNQVIGGAVNPIDGSFWVLAYDAVGASQTSVGLLDTRALLYRVDPATGAIQAKGSAFIPRFGSPRVGASNGDLYFDASGNAHILQTLFGFNNGPGPEVAKGQTQVHIVRAADLDAATATTSLKFSSGRVVTLSGLDQNTGVAYEFPTGNVIISDLDSSVSFNPSNPSVKTRTNSGLREGMDLASCAFPHTVELHKKIVNRVRPEHQFNLAISRSDSSVIASETTTGTAVGVQNEYVGPLPTNPGAKLILSETLTGAQSGETLSLYSPSIECEETSYAGQLKVTVSPVSGQVGRYTLTMPQLPEGATKSLRVSCTITNKPTPKSGQVKVVKKLRPVNGSADGSNDQALADWPFTIDAGAASLTPADTTLRTGTDGSATWSLPSGTVKLSEGLTAGDKTYRFVSGSCNRNGQDLGSTFTTNDSTVTVSNLSVSAGDLVTCTFVNQEVVPRGSVTFKKSDSDGNALAGSAWTLVRKGGQASTFDDCVASSAEQCQGLDKDPQPGVFAVSDLELGDYVLSEQSAPEGYLTSEDSHEFSLTRQQPNFAFDEPFINYRPPSITLPLSGGVGALWFTIGGLGLIALAALMSLRFRNSL